LPATAAGEDAESVAALEAAELPARFPRGLHPTGGDAAVCDAYDPATDPALQSATVRGTTAQLFSGPVLTVSVFETDDTAAAARIADSVAATCVAQAGVFSPPFEYTGDAADVTAFRWGSFMNLTYETVFVVDAGDRVAVIRLESYLGVPAQAETDEIVDGVVAALGPSG
jgi:hypothetical protein